MKITFAGVGSAFADSRYYQSNLVIESEGKRLLIDCGGDARFSFGELGATNANIGNWADGLYLTHLHADHVGGLEWLAFCTYFNPTVPKPKLYISADQVDDLWNISRIGLSSIEGIDVSLDTFFDMRVNHDGFFEWEGIAFELVKGHHVYANDKLMPVYGLFMESPTTGKTAYFTADTMMSNLTNMHCHKANLIFHDCETYARRSGVHAYYDDLAALDPKLKSKMWLYHYGPDPSQNPEKDGFCGFIQKGQSFEL